MAQTIKIKRGGFSGLGSLSLTAGEMALVTGSIPNIDSLNRFITINDGTNTLLPVGAVLTGSTDPNINSYSELNGALFYNSTNKQFIRLDSAGNQNLDIAATVENALTAGDGIFYDGSTGGTFDGSTALTISVDSGSIAINDLNTTTALSVANGGTGLDEIADNSVLVSTAADTLSVVSLATNGALLVGGTTTGPAAVAPATLEGDGITATGTDGSLVLSVQNLNDTITVAAGGISVNTGSISSGGTNLVNADVINSLSASIATDITNNTGNVEGVAGQVAYFDGTNSVSGSGGFTFSDDVLTVGGSTFGANVTITGDLTVSGTTTTVNSTQVDIGDRIITLNSLSNTGDGGIYVNDNSTAQTGSLLWDSSEDYWIAGLKDSEKRVVTFNDNSGGTDTAIQRLNGDSDLVDSTITDDGDDVSIDANVAITAGHTLTAPNAVTFSGLTITDSAAVTDEVLFVQTDGTVGQIDATATTDVMNGILGYTDGLLTFSTVIDGGTF